MMAEAGGQDSADWAEALLRPALTRSLPAPPIETRDQRLPLGELEWHDAERLFLRLLSTVRQVQFAKLFGVPGQAQAGIDAYARLPPDLTGRDTSGRNYIALQSRRVTSLTAAKIEKAVDDFLEGEWAAKTSSFYFATSVDLQDTKLDTAIRQQAERLAELKITFVPWGLQEVSALLKEHPRIVEDFFGRPWVERFCGPEAVSALADKTFVRVADWTETTAVRPAQTLRAFLAHHQWDDGDPKTQAGNVTAMATFAESIRILSRPAREMLVLVLRRGRDLIGPTGFGATYAVELQELVDVTELTMSEVMSRAGQLAVRNLVKIKYEDWDFDDFAGPYVATRPHFGDVQWEDIVSYCGAHQVSLEEIFVDLRFDLLDDPAADSRDGAPPGHPSAP